MKRTAALTLLYLFSLTCGVAAWFWPPANIIGLICLLYWVTQVWPDPNDQSTTTKEI